MRSALGFLLLAIFLQREGSWATSDDDFKPMMIPLNNWRSERRDGSSDMQESIVTEETATAVPVHYWEDALRHSVYLTLVRDKIDQLIAKGDTKFDNHVSKEVDDHDLWDKIKTAPFDRIYSDEPDSLADVAIVAKGRLIDDKNGFRFAEDEKSKEKCNNEKCFNGVKAFWSVKRVKQVDADPGKYHYELTFSVNTQIPKKHKRPNENPVRTFTVRESSPERIVDKPEEYHRHYDSKAPTLPQRAERTIWVHKNIIPSHRYQSRPHNDLERIFSSFFLDDDDPPPRYIKPQPQYVPQSYHPYTKVSYVGSPSEQHQQKRVVPYPYKPQQVKYSRPLPPSSPTAPHVQHHYLDIEQIGVVSNPYVSPTTDHRYVVPKQGLKTQKPPVIPPTPPMPVTIFTNDTFEETTESLSITTESSQQLTTSAKLSDDDNSYTTQKQTTTNRPEVVASYNNNYIKQKPTQVKLSYFSDHVRPPVYNAPPGVFVTMDKKPFKPLPPIKYIHSSKPLKSHRPVDFRPSPQVVDMQGYSEPDPLFDTAFRPITVHYTNNTVSSTTQSVQPELIVSSEDNPRKPTANRKKPSKKHESPEKGHRITTPEPEIITAHTETQDDQDSLQWANVVGALAKTTPMAIQNEVNERVTEKVTEKAKPSSTTQKTTTVITTPSTTTTYKTRRYTTTTTTTAEPVTTTKSAKKRTRPPPKFTKPEKPKKHKRVTSTTTKAPEKFKLEHDLTPQASSAAAGTSASWWDQSVKPLTSSTTPNTTPQETTVAVRQTITTTTTTTEIPQSTTITEKPRNRYRQSALMHKGTSPKLEKWSKDGDNKTRTMASGLSQRRKGSNFQTHIPSTTPKQFEYERERVYHVDHTPGKNQIRTTSTTAEVAPSTEILEQQVNEMPNEEDEVDIQVVDVENGNTDDQELKDQKEYIFYPNESPDNDKNNEINEEDEDTFTTIATVVTSISVSKNKTKCKKKNMTTTEDPMLEQYEENEALEVIGPLSTTDISIAVETFNTTTSSPDIFEELFSGFNFDDAALKEDEHNNTTDKTELDVQESEKHEHFLKGDEDIDDLIEMLENDEKERHPDGKIDDEYEEEDEDQEEEDTEEDEPAIDDNDEEEALLVHGTEDNKEGRDSHSDSDDYREHSYSLLELMAME